MTCLSLLILLISPTFKLEKERLYLDDFVIILHFILSTKPMLPCAFLEKITSVVNIHFYL